MDAEAIHRRMLFANWLDDAIARQQWSADAQRDRGKREDDFTACVIRALHEARDKFLEVFP